ncbi:sulfoxide reductase heme-binding subunit YedZ [Bisgaard Taxon 10/6]|uniref:Protein-methionine-sulfoxide reductase heme-binding subunit MsrQ n=1 Tax=Exercitatus varius TaxID=67857 RepID=A0ABT6ENH0_9PAST|nr:protein-methionine-sulfoxide reductase heme-binding subunit MsrQ [Exercitatus varius]QOF68131.1 sulfoxide reductase heme-binding subunit YedZ [Actinobacillus sp. GY-402]MDG2915998.1 sulfoxide reductase heme-binding subunit YedZ [Exercitatus varius]MDG2939346.1 sulfoxide reductase heme-binding subunit YedZ [Exercitatus varius]MDG2941104.1 sulfoxide reductase heme-binding subunit YedZ [Exercitatus varius]MDG2944780.1 sulfoxide reductase heme-binding subunit YedZ [Exercitatus varius]
MLFFVRSLIHLICLSPALWLSFVLYRGGESLGADPVKEIQHFLGFTAISILLSVFLLRILITLGKQSALSVLHRSLGLWAIFYVLLHLLSYFLLELDADLSLFFHEISRRTYLILGFLSLLILFIVPISLIPFVRRHLGKNWLALHKLVYFSLFFAVIHYLLATKSIEFMAIVYSVLTVVFLIIIFYQKSQH